MTSLGNPDRSPFGVESKLEGDLVVELSASRPASRQERLVHIAGRLHLFEPVIWRRIGLGAVGTVAVVAAGLAVAASVRRLWRLVGLATMPVTSWVEQHQRGMPWSAGELTAAWWIIGVVLFVAAVVGNVSGRVGWTIFGVATTAAGYSGTSDPAKPVAAAILGFGWVLLSIPAFITWWRTPATRSAEADARTGTTPSRPWKSGTGQAAGEPVVADWRDLPGPEFLGQVLTLLLRRRATTARHRLAMAGPSHWTVLGGSENTFSAVRTDEPDGNDGPREVRGAACSPEAIAELLADAVPSAGPPKLRWDREELRPTLWDVPFEELQFPPELPPMSEFLEASPHALALVVAHLERRKETLGDEVSPEHLPWTLEDAANDLNAGRPLLNDVPEMLPSEPSGRYRLGYVDFFDWVETRTIVKTKSLRWNEFGDHRPDQVALIAGKLLRDDPEEAVPFVLGEDGHLHLIRIPGPAGPLHIVGRNGLHRTHAFALLDIPIIAGEVSVYGLPACVAAVTSTYGAPIDTDRVTPWRGLMREGLLEGVITGPPEADDISQVLYPTWVAAPWMLLSAEIAARVATSYERTYPGALHDIGVPYEAIDSPSAWRRWLA